METINFAEELKVTAEESKKKQMDAENEAAQEQRRLADENVAEYINEHKESFIEELANNAKLAAEQGLTTARISRREDPENREGLYQTIREVRDYYRGEGFKAGMDSGDDARMVPKDDDWEWLDATHCWAQLSIDWSHQQK
jgi:hypothetical protein